MKVCPVCQIDFFGHGNRIFCYNSCQRVGKYTRLKMKMQYPWLAQELFKLGIRKEQIPEKADGEFLSDLLFALQVTKK